MALFYSTVPERHDTETGSQHAEYQDPETEVDKWNSVTIHFIIYTRAFPTVTCQTVSCQTYTCSDRNVFFYAVCCFVCIPSTRIQKCPTVNSGERKILASRRKVDIKRKVVICTLGRKVSLFHLSKLLPFTPLTQFFLLLSQPVYTVPVE